MIVFNMNYIKFVNRKKLIEEEKLMEDIFKKSEKTQLAKKQNGNLE